MDEKYLEVAEALVAAQLQNGVEKVCAQVRKRDPNFDGICEDCTDEIPEARLDTGATRCIECQEVLEFRQAQYRR